jgi:hypothetical protein
VFLPELSNITEYVKFTSGETFRMVMVLCVEEFMEPLAVTQGQLAEAMGVSIFHGCLY